MRARWLRRCHGDVTTCGPGKESRIDGYPTSVKTEGVASIQDLEHLYRSRFHRYLRVAEAIAGEPQRSLDAVQEGFARALASIESFRGDARLETWVWRCVVNAAQSTRRQVDSPLTDEITESLAGQEAPDLGLQPLIAALAERQRLALFLRYYADLDYRAIADVLEVDIGTVGATLHKAHASIRRGLTEVPR
jgi:RNA polymerase sigma-70 factor (ECF subfamily)